MELFLAEHKKLWKKKSTVISAVLCFIYIFIAVNILSFQWISFGSYKDGFVNNFDGYAQIRNKQEYGEKWKGKLTDDLLQQMIIDYQQMLKNEEIDIVWNADWSTMANWLKTLYSELKVEGSYELMLDYVDPYKITDFYGRRQEKIEEFLENNGQTGDEEEFLLQMNSHVEVPFSYEWTDGWYFILCNVIPNTETVVEIFIAIVLSTIFAGEWHDKTSTLVLTTKKGWKELACAKIGSGIAFICELFLALVIGNIALQIIYLGTRGWDMPIQCIKMLAVAPLNMLQAEIYQYIYILSGAIGFAGEIMLISALVKNNFISVLMGIALLYIPSMISNYLPLWAQKGLDLLPLTGSSLDIFRTNTFKMLGNYIWSPYLLVIVPVLIGCLCMPLTVKIWMRRTKI